MAAREAAGGDALDPVVGEPGQVGDVVMEPARAGQQRQRSDDPIDGGFVAASFCRP